jgi:polar amino acid transport system ATP-binding protein
MTPLIMFNQVNKWYGEYQALTDLSAEIRSGEVVVVCGPSGSGKSTLIRTVNRLEPIQDGQILFEGLDINGSSTRLNHLRTRIGFVFQNFNLFPHISVLENVMISPIKVLGVRRYQARKEAMALLERVGLAHKADGSPVASSSELLSHVRWR